MRVVLQIGHTEILLPDDKHLSTIMGALAKGVEVYTGFALSLGLEKPIRTTGRPMAVSCVMVPEETRVEVSGSLHGEAVDSEGSVGDLQFPGTALSTRVRRPAKPNGRPVQRRLLG